jgi:(p)ppGpp synthase/HD superfamily hydrolase
MKMTSIWSQDLYISAYRFAAEAHWKTKQLVPGTDIPYLMHFTLVSMEVIAALEKESDLDGNLAVQCALLHDTIEDTDITYEQLVERFGTSVADCVNALTKDESIGENLPKQQKKDRQMTDSLERIKQQPREIWMVKMADRITNLQPPPKDWTKEKINRYREEAITIYELLKEGSEYLAARLLKKIDDYRVTP